MKNIGLYIHIPFCNGKCPYCDFFSINRNTNDINAYTQALCRKIGELKGKYHAETVYFGGGTPSCIGTANIIKIMDSINASFGTNYSECTIEVNPESAKNIDFSLLKDAGINRVSMGLQSANENELKALGRKHSAKDVECAVKLIKASGIDNISLDLMLGISQQTIESLDRSILFCSELDVSHISAYMLKIEQSTPYYDIADTLSLPDEDEVCTLYEYTVGRLAELGYAQYEISNFAKKGKESRHNLKYWNCEEYLGLGAAAHSFIDKKRFYYERDIDLFYRDVTADDGTGGTEDEYIAMRLRLSKGINAKDFKAYFGYDIPQKYIDKALKLEKMGYTSCEKEGFRLTVKGFLISNTIITEILTA